MVSIVHIISIIKFLKYANKVVEAKKKNNHDAAMGSLITAEKPESAETKT